MNIEIKSVPPLVALLRRHMPIAVPPNIPPQSEQRRMSFVTFRFGIISAKTELRTIIRRE